MRYFTPTAYRRSAAITLAALYFLILVGGTVRATGAGMGCPDWPKCFGMWIPPTDASQLPENYQEIYADRGYAETEFNAVKTWTEYINRLIGAATGLLVAGTFVVSLGLARRDGVVPALSGAAVLLTGFQAWLGSVVVASNLEEGMITLHMGMALVIVGVLIYAFARAQRIRGDVAELDAYPRSFGLQALLVAALILSLAQVLMGTQVREMIDAIARLDANRAVWVEQLGGVFYVHRSFSLVVLAVNAAIAWQVFRRLGGDAPLWRATAGIIAVIVASIASGALLYYLDMPPVLQPVHLLLGALLFGLQFYLLVRYRAVTRPAGDVVPGETAPSAR